jgi:hypothetical protein
MIKREDKLKNLLSKSPKKTWPEEVNMTGAISPVAKIIVVGVGWG